MSLMSEQPNNSKATFGRCPVFIFAAMTYGLSIGIPVSLSVMFLDWQETFQASRAHTAAIHSTCAGVLFGASVIPGYTTNRFGARITIFIGSFLASIGFVLSMFATNINHLIFTTGVLGGLGCCFLQIPILPCLANIFTKYRSLVISFCTICTAVALTVIPNVYGYLAEHYSWRGVLGIFACIVLNMSVSGMIVTSVASTKPTNGREESARALTEDPNDMTSNKSLYEEENADEINGTIDVEDTIHCSQMENSSDQNKALCQESFTSKYDNNPYNFVRRIKASKWRFILDPVFNLFVAHSTFCLASIFTFPFLLMDFSKSKGFEESKSITFYSVMFISSIFGRVLAAVLNLSSHFHSITLYSVFSMGNLIIFFLLTFITGYNSIMACLTVFGLCYGAVIALQMKCIVDIKAVDLKSYPLAIGFCGTIEGIADFTIPILIGYSVDVTGSYTSILIAMGCVGFIFNIALGIGFRYFSRKE